jgi:hypothetical protein
MLKTYSISKDTVYLVYVDDIVLTASTADLLQRMIIALQWEFAMKDLGPLHHFLGITTECRPQGLFLHQRQYAIDILERAGMSDCKPCSTSADAVEFVIQILKKVTKLASEAEAHCREASARNPGTPRVRGVRPPRYGSFPTHNRVSPL